MIEIIARFNDTGIFLGGHTRDAAGMPMSINTAQLPGVINTVNVAAMAHAAVLEAELVAVKAEYAAFKARATTGAVQARTIIADTSITDADTCARIDALVDDMLQNKDERELAAADKVIADAIAAREKLVRAQ